MRSSVPLRKSTEPSMRAERCALTVKDRTLGLRCIYQGVLGYASFSVPMRSTLRAERATLVRRHHLRSRVLSRRLMAFLHQQLRGEPLGFTDPLDFDRRRVDRLFDASQSLCHFVQRGEAT